MIYDISFNSSYDMYLSNGDIAFTDEDYAVKRRLESRLQFVLGEWFLDTDQGIPYPQFIFQKGTSLDSIYAIIRTVADETEGVEEITKLELTPDTENESLTIVLVVNSNVEVEVTI